MKKILFILLIIPFFLSSCTLFGIPEVRYRQNMLDGTILQGVRFDGAVYEKTFYVGTSTDYLNTSTGSGIVECKIGGTWKLASENIQLEGGKNSIFISGTVGAFDVTAQKDKK
jgi:hypothetical protein